MSINMVPLTEFRNRVRMELMNVPNPMIEMKVIEAAREFCRETQVWRADMDPISTIAGQAEYDIDVPVRHAESVAIIAARQNGMTIYPRSEKVLDVEWPNWRRDQADTARYFVSDDPTVLRLVPVPVRSRSNAIVDMRIALRPARNATRLPDLLLRDYLEQIAMGAQGRLCAMIGKTWTDPNRATYWLNEFQREINAAKIRATRNYQNEIITVTPRRLQGAP